MLDTKKVINKEVSGKGKDCHQILVLCSASLTSFAAGTLYTFTSPAIPKLLTGDYNFTIEQTSYITIIPPVLLLVLIPFFCILSDKIGRKYTLYSAGIFHAISWITTAFAKDIYVFYFARVLYGISEGGLYAGLPAYIAEITTPKVRSLYGNVMVLSIYIGQFFMNCIGYYFSIQTASLIMLTVPILFLVTFIFVPETPYYLLMKGDKEGAKISLQKLRCCEDVSEELDQIDFDVRRQLSERGIFKDLFKIKSNRKALIIAMSARMFQQYSGLGPLIVYCQYFFLQAGGSISSETATMIVSAELAVLIVLGNVIADKFGRRRCLIMSAFASGMVLYSESIYFYLKEYDMVDLSALSWFPVLGTMLFIVTFCSGLGLVPNAIMGEVFSSKIRKHATTLTVMLLAANACIVLKVFQVAMDYLGLWVLFLIFGSCCFASFILSYFIIPETNGKTLEEIQQMLKGNKLI